MLLIKKKEAEETNSMLRKYSLSNVNFEIWDVYKEFFNKKNLRKVPYILWITSAYALSANLIAWMPYYLEQFHITLTLQHFHCWYPSYHLLKNFIGIVLITLTLDKLDKLGKKTWGVLGLELTSIPMLLYSLAWYIHVLT